MKENQTRFQYWEAIAQQKAEKQLKKKEPQDLFSDKFNKIQKLVSAFPVSYVVFEDLVTYFSQISI